jgi:hypothetical protein
MKQQLQAYAAGAVGFAFAVVWATLGLRTALACLFAAGVGAGAARYGQRRPQLGRLSVSRHVEQMRTRVTSLAASTRKPAPPRQTRTRSGERRVGGYPVTKQVQETTYGW